VDSPSGESLGAEDGSAFIESLLLAGLFAKSSALALGTGGEESGASVSVWISVSVGVEAGSSLVGLTVTSAIGVNVPSGIGASLNSALGATASSGVKTGASLIPEGAEVGGAGGRPAMVAASGAAAKTKSSSGVGVFEIPRD
jgi:hypothetical protein